MVRKAVVNCEFVNLPPSAGWFGNLYIVYVFMEFLLYCRYGLKCNVT